MPLSREFLLNRGYCCNLGCLNCPYKEQSMYDINSVTVSGNLVADPETKMVGDNVSLAKLRLASNRGNKENEQTIYIDVDCWRGLANIVSERCTKGQKIVVNGMLKQDSWEQDGVKRSKIYIVANDVILA